MESFKIRKSTMGLLLIFVFLETICLAIFNANWIRCAPCAPDTDCPTCISSIQYYCIGIGTIVALSTIATYAYIYFKNRSLHL